METRHIFIFCFLLVLGLYFCYKGTRGIFTRRMRVRNPYHRASSPSLLGKIIHNELNKDYSPFDPLAQSTHLEITGFDAIARATLTLLFGLVIIFVAALLPMYL